MSRWIRIGRKRILDTRPDWRDPDMPVLRSWKEQDRWGFVTAHSEMVSPAFSQELSAESLANSDDGKLSWREDKTYFPAGETPVIPPPPEVAPEDEAEVGRCSSPWGGRELKAIRSFQNNKAGQPLTCPTHKDTLHVDELELSCPVAGCDYTQDWVPDVVAGVKR
jgi:hypothetical protein